jgi:hypothetical protein
MMAEQPKAQPGGDRKSEEYHWGSKNPDDPVPTLASQGIDKNLAKRIDRTLDLPGPAKRPLSGLLMPLRHRW